MEQAYANQCLATLLGYIFLSIPPPFLQVYKGRLGNGTLVAIRYLALQRKYSIRNLKLQLDLLSKLSHPHLVGLLGHCIDGRVQGDSATDRLFLVYEFVPSGNFRSLLSGTCITLGLKLSRNPLFMSTRRVQTMC